MSSLRWQGIALNQRNALFIGFSDESPLDIAVRINTDTTVWESLVPSQATHASVWFFHNCTGTIRVTVATYFTNETDNTKTPDLTLHALEVITLLATRGLVVTAVTMDGAQTNTVSTHGQRVN